MHSKSLALQPIGRGLSMAFLVRLAAFNADAKTRSRTAKITKNQGLKKDEKEEEEEAKDDTKDGHKDATKNADI